MQLDIFLESEVEVMLIAVDGWVGGESRSDAPPLPSKARMGVTWKLPLLPGEAAKASHDETVRIYEIDVWSLAARYSSAFTFTARHADV